MFVCCSPDCLLRKLKCKKRKRGFRVGVQVHLRWYRRLLAVHQGGLRFLWPLPVPSSLSVPMLPAAKPVQDIINFSNWDSSPVPYISGSNCLLHRGYTCFNFFSDVWSLIYVLLSADVSATKLSLLRMALFNVCSISNVFCPKLSFL